ncbi:MAG: enolase C-terminal domain-like protein [Verrucomicrobiota bacterium]
MSSHPKAISIKEVSLHFLPVVMRVPLKFGAQIQDSVTCARARVVVEGPDGRLATGWGETPLAVAWVWPSDLDYEDRHEALKSFTTRLAKDLSDFGVSGHPLEIGHDFIEDRLPQLQDEFNEARPEGANLPHLAALVCFSLLDIAVHDAFGQLHDCPTYATYGGEFLSRDLSAFLTPSAEHVSFSGRFPSDFLVSNPDLKLPVWHLVGGLDPIGEEELTGNEPDDGYPVLLRDWIQRDQLDCLKIKLRGTDLEWDFDRLVKIGEIAREEGVTWLTTDFNCTVTDPAYVDEILDRLKSDDPVTYQKILYVEQPFPYDLEANRIDVRSVSARKPLFMDESAHDWKFVRMGRDLGWTGVALKTCKTQTGALLSLSWAKAHGMTLMVQDLTNPMLAQVPHFLLAAHAGTIMGVESNGMQFYPEASAPERNVHPGLYRRQGGILDGSTLLGGANAGRGFGYRVEEIGRTLPAPVVGS